MIPQEQITEAAIEYAHKQTDNSILTSRETTSKWLGIIDGYKKGFQDATQQLQPKWIKIESEDDLPKENGTYWIANQNGVFDWVSNKEQIIAKYRNKTLTHYMKMEYPQPPQD